MCINRSQQRNYLLLFEWSLQKLNRLVVTENIKSHLAWTLWPAVFQDPICRLKNAVLLILLWLMWLCINAVYMLKQCKLSDMKKYCPTLKAVFSYCFKVDNGQLAKDSAEHWTVVCSNHRLAIQRQHFFCSCPIYTEHVVPPETHSVKTKHKTRNSRNRLYSLQTVISYVYAVNAFNKQGYWKCPFSMYKVPKPNLEPVPRIPTDKTTVSTNVLGPAVNCWLSSYVLSTEMCPSYPA